MGKISEHLEHLEKLARESVCATVGKFAVEMGKSLKEVLRQLREAGVHKTVGTDALTLIEQSKLLAYLQKKHATKGPRKRITLVKIESETDRLLRVVAAQEKGAEWECLNYIFESVFGDHEVEPKLQAVANLIVAKAVISGVFPAKKSGRPAKGSFDDSGYEICIAYWMLRDRGASYVQASEQLAAKFHKDVRNIMRLVKKYKHEVGITLEEREKNRKWWSLMAQMSDGIKSTRTAQIMLGPFSDLELTLEDGLEYLDEKILKSIQPKNC